MRKFWNFDDSGGAGSERTLYINGDIAEESWWGNETTPRQFRADLDAGAGNLCVWINSQGGEVFAAAQIYTMLREYAQKGKGHVTVKIEGLAASAASVIAMAGERTLMSPVSCLLIHNPYTIAFGDSGDMQQAKEMLDEVKESIINAYQAKSGLSRAVISHLMDAESLMNANKAVQLGFADDILYNENPVSNHMNVAAGYTVKNILSKAAPDEALHTESAKPENTGSRVAYEELAIRINILDRSF